MIVNSDSNQEPGKIIAKSCQRFAQQLGLTVKTTPNAFTIEEALANDDEFWVSTNCVDIDTIEEFIRLCLSYAKNTDRVHTGRMIIQVDCPNNHSMEMTPRQFHMNTVRADASTFLMCNKCGEIIKIPERNQ
jgi:hypothetical protein